MRQPQGPTAIRRLAATMLFLAAGLGLVYALPALTPSVRAEKTANPKAIGGKSDVEILRDISTLPAEVNRMRGAILEAAMSGEINAMRIPVEMNEIPPMVAREKISDPIDHLRTASGDGEGREMMARMIQLFRSGFVRQSPGTGDEMYVWPYFAALDLGKLTPAQEVELLTIVSPERAKAMKSAGKYDDYRIGIGHDGVWHYFADHIE
ncbi:MULTISPECIES: hypothetical protein [Rhodomicrobium]|uniref:hypothetical protein n=1 Tax=Rhodomicrobium TaxID=1068 RepID=UPI000F74B341|nr:MULTISPECIES: hypothetical protein [Rhodomicrobium]